MNITIIVIIIAFKIKFSERCVCLKCFSKGFCSFISNIIIRIVKCYIVWYKKCIETMKVKFSEGYICFECFSDCSCAFISNSFACGILTNKLKAHHSYCVTISLSSVVPSSISLMYVGLLLLTGLLLFMSFKFFYFYFKTF